MVDAQVVVGGAVHSHIAFHTKPWKSVIEFRSVRGLFDNYIEDATRRCLKSVSDYSRLADYFDTRLPLSVEDQKYLSNSEFADLVRLRRDLCRAFKQKAFGLVKEGMTAQQFCDLLLDRGLRKYGVDCVIAQVQNQNPGRAKIKPHTTPKTRRVVEIIESLKPEFTGFEPDKILAVGDSHLALGATVGTPCDFTRRLAQELLLLTLLIIPQTTGPSNVSQRLLLTVGDRCRDMWLTTVSPRHDRESLDSVWQLRGS